MADEPGQPTLWRLRPEDARDRATCTACSRDMPDVVQFNGSTPGPGWVGDDVAYICRECITAALDLLDATPTPETSNGNG